MCPPGTATSSSRAPRAWAYFLELLLAHQAEPLRVHEQGRKGESRGRRRLGAELAVGRDDRRAAKPPAQPPVARGNEVLSRFLLDELPRRRCSTCQPRLDRLFDRGEGMVERGLLREVEADMREDLDRGIEQDGCGEPFGRLRG